jgi:hypothetical protein
MKEEVVIISGDIKNVYENGKDLTNGFTNYVYEKWKNPKAILQDPQYAALHVNGTDSIRAIMEIDFEKSDLKNGVIVPNSVVAVEIPIRFGKNKLRGLQYTSFRKLITHVNTDSL